MTNTELTKIREEKKLTKSEFAELLGITAMMEGKYEKGSAAIPESVVEKINALKKPAAKPAKKSAKAAARKAKTPALYIESLMGGIITSDEILSRVPKEAEAVYVKPEENKAYWVKGDESGSVDLWG